MVQLGKPVVKWCSHYKGISWALETPGFRAALKDGLLFCNMLSHLPSAILVGFPHKREGAQSATLQGCFPFGNGPTQPLVARKPMNRWGLEEYSGERLLCTCPVLTSFFGHCQRREVGKRDLSFDLHSHSYALTSSSVIRFYGLLRQAVDFATPLSPEGQGYLCSARRESCMQHGHTCTGEPRDRAPPSSRVLCYRVRLLQTPFQRAFLACRTRR